MANKPSTRPFAPTRPSWKLPIFLALAPVVEPLLKLSVSVCLRILLAARLWLVRILPQSLQPLVSTHPLPTNSFPPLSLTNFPSRRSRVGRSPGHYSGWHWNAAQIYPLRQQRHRLSFRRHLYRSPRRRKASAALSRRQRSYRRLLYLFQPIPRPASPQNHRLPITIFGSCPHSRRLATRRHKSPGRLACRNQSRFSF